jgi:8-oxo-dGTP diphosphatase
VIYTETLLYVVKNGRVLLIRKKRGLGAGFFNGVGGKAKPGETPEQAAVREMAEEVGTEPLEMEGEVSSSFGTSKTASSSLYTTSTSSWRGGTRESCGRATRWLSVLKFHISAKLDISA